MPDTYATIIIIVPNSRAHKRGEVKGKYRRILRVKEGNTDNPVSNMLHHIKKGFSRNCQQEVSE